MLEGGSACTSISINSKSGEVVKVKVKFSTTTDNMRRLYITKNTGGMGEEPFVFTHQEVDEKPDGSLDLTGADKKNFEFQIDLPAATLADGNIIYKFWVTTGRGDFRDITKRNAIKPDVVGTITIKYGSGTNSSNGIKELKAIKLFAPSGDGKTSTFYSLYNETIYKIEQGVEYVSLWDFGYYYGQSGKASLASTADYPKAVIDIPTVANAAGETLNKAYFKLSAKTVTEYDAISDKAGLDFVAATAQSVNDLKVNDVIEVIDNYGNKGLIKVVELVPGYGNTDHIIIDIKIQVK